MNIEFIKPYFAIRGLKYPNVVEAILFAMTELGEVCDALLRSDKDFIRNNDREANAPMEIADTIMMLVIALDLLAPETEANTLLVSKIRTKLNDEQFQEYQTKVEQLLLDKQKRYLEQLEKEEAKGGEGPPIT